MTSIIRYFRFVFSKSNTAEERNSTSGIEKQEHIKHLADAVKDKSKQLVLQTGSMPLYKISLKEEKISVTGCKCFHFGQNSNKPNRTIMVLGATGAGKTTLINGMINYILGVKWEDSYRFKLVDEDQSKSQAHSQTSEVTVYKLNHQEGFKIEHSLTIVDTPGFGDTRGIERDKEITEQLHNLFTAELGVTEIDAVCFVVQAALARLTPTQKYVFDSVLSIFGKDIAENIRVLVTFADGQKPPVLEAIKASGVPCPETKEGQPRHFKFNNSALYADNKSSAADSMSEDDEDESFDKMFWGMGTKSMKRFFAALNVTKTKSLILTKEVLRERKQLEISVENLQKQVKVGLAKLEEIKQTTDILKEHEAEISRNKDFKFEVTVTKPFQKDISGTGNYITNCQQCHFTCHYPCSRSNDADKARCAAMGPDGNCRQCKGKCPWNVHFNQKYRWKYKEVKEKRTVKELKKKYLKATGAKAPVQALIEKLKAEYDDVQAEVVKFMERSAQCLNRLKEIALRPNPLSTPEYIDMLIEGEKSEAKPGWMQRVQALMAMREKAETMAKVERGERPLTMTKEVLKERQQLEISVESLQKKVKVGLAKLEEIKETADILREYEAEISRNKDFKFEVTCRMLSTEDISGTGKYTTNCQQCHFTCHYPCEIPNDADKKNCSAMGPDGNCTECPGKCYWNVHFHQNYIWRYKAVREEQTVQDLEKKYLKATGAEAPVQALIERLTAEYDDVQAEVVKCMERSAQCLNTLRPNPLSTSEYIDVLIEGEKSEAQPGWKQRVQALMAMREKAEYMAKAERGEKLLILPKEVLKERQQLEISVESLQKQVKDELAKLEEIKETTDILKDHEAEINRNKDFKFEVTCRMPSKEDISGTGKYTTNCQQCDFTCHYPCEIPNDADKKNCSAMGPDGNCTECPGKCYWNVHFHQNYIWRYKAVREEQTVQDLEKKYLKATGAEAPVQALIERLTAEYDDVQAEVVKCMERSAQCLNTLRPNPLSTSEYIDVLIEGEKSEAQPGWKQRVQALMAMREKAEYMAKAERGEKLLILPKEVLKERQQLEISVESLQKQVKDELAKLEEIKETTDILKDHEAEINRNKDFKFEVTCRMPSKEDISGTGKYTTNCQQCDFTCHYPCEIPNDADKKNCSAMGPDGNCTECPGKCYWNVHFHQNYIWRYKAVREEQTVQDLEKKYLKATGAEEPVQALIERLTAEYDDVQAEVVKCMERSAQCLNTLRPNPLSTSEYIDMLIEGEKSDAQPGWMQRVQALMDMREKAETMAELERGERPLTMTKEVLRERKQLEISVENLQKQVKDGLAKLEEIKETTDILREHEAEISRNKDFKFEVTCRMPSKEDISGTGKYTTNCQQCDFTCHYPCEIPNDADKKNCSAMGPDGNCTECPGKCHWNVHFHQNYIWRYKAVREEQTVKDLEKKYLKATGAKAPVQALIERLTAEYDDVQAEVVKCMERSAQCLNTLRPNPLSTSEYIDMLIEGEKSDAQPGWKKRVQALMDMSEKAEYMAKLERGEKLL